jgi:hypothetical protein
VFFAKLDFLELIRLFALSFFRFAAKKDAAAIRARGGFSPEAAALFFDEAHAEYFCWELNGVCTSSILRASSRLTAFLSSLHRRKEAKGQQAGKCAFRFAAR